MSKKKNTNFREKIANPFIDEDYLVRLKDIHALDLRDNTNITFLDNGYVKVNAKNDKKQHTEDHDKDR